MTDLIVVWDQVREIATVVDMDTATAVGPVMAGDDAGPILQAFLDAVPFNIDLLPPDARIEAFASFLQGDKGMALLEGPALVAVEDEPGGPGDLDTNTTDAARSVREAVEHGDGPPPPQPADADAALDTDTGAQTVEVVCSMCQGERFVEGEPCPLCKGSGKLTMPVAS